MNRTVVILIAAIAAVTGGFLYWDGQQDVSDGAAEQPAAAVSDPAPVPAPVEAEAATTPQPDATDAATETATTAPEPAPDAADAISDVVGAHPGGRRGHARRRF